MNLYDDGWLDGFTGRHIRTLDPSYLSGYENGRAAMLADEKRWGQAA